MAAIQVINLSKHYNQIKAIDKLNLQFPKSKISALLGPNGAGKSTFMRCLVGLIKPTSGEFVVQQKKINFKDHDYLRHIGSIIEKPDFYNYLSAYKNLKYLASLHGLTQSKQKIEEVLSLVGILNRAHDKVKTFSHGMKQRLGIAHALLHDPDIIILDEPTTGLDPEGIIEFRNLLIKLRDVKQMTIIISSHILSEVEMIADYIVVLNRGQVMEQGFIKDLLREDIMNVYIETNDNPNAQTLISDHLSLEVIPYGNIIKTKTNKNIIPELVRLLTDKGIKIYNLETKRGLEELYLNITTGVS